MPWMRLRAFSHDSNIWFSSQYDWQISAFGEKVGTDDRLYELQTSSDHQFETAQLSVSHFHWFIQLGLWLLFHWCAFGAQSSSVPSMSHSVTKNKKGENELQEFLHFITLPGYLSGSSVPVLFLTSAYSPYYIYLFIEISSEEDSTVHLGSLFQCLIILFGNMIVVVYCCKCCCKKLVTFCLTQSGCAEEFVSSLC